MYRWWTEIGLWVGIPPPFSAQRCGKTGRSERTSSKQRVANGHALFTRVWGVREAWYSLWAMQNRTPYDPYLNMPPAPQEASGSARRAVLITVAYTVLIMLLALWSGYELFGWARDRMVANLPAYEPRVVAGAAPAVNGQDAVAAASGQPDAQSVAVAPRTPSINILLLGTDERPDEGGPQRTDTLILATLDPDSQTAGMLSLPRDLWVPFPTLGYSTKINTAYGIGEQVRYTGGGPQLVMDTVSGFVGQSVPYYVRINFTGFTELVDLIGGIDINVPKTIHDDKYPTPDEGIETFHLDAGLQHMDGQTALKYARTRNVDDDYGRSGRQQDVIRAVMDKVLSAQLLPTLLARAPQLLSTLRNSVDTNIPIDKLIELATYVSDNPPREIRQLVLDSRFGEETYSPEGMWILLPDRAKVRAAVSTFFTPPAATAAVAADGAAAPADSSRVNIEVLNGTGVPGMAAKTRDLLEARGWQVDSIGDADRGDYTQSILINYGVSEAVIQEVSSALGISPSLASVTGLNPDTHVELRLVLGQDLLPIINN